MNESIDYNFLTNEAIIRHNLDLRYPLVFIHGIHHNCRFMIPEHITYVDANTIALKLFPCEVEEHGFPLTIVIRNFEIPLKYFHRTIDRIEEPEAPIHQVQPPSNNRTFFSWLKHRTHSDDYNRVIDTNSYKCLTSKRS